MEVRRRSKSGSGERLRQLRAVKASEALPLPLHLTNAVFIPLFFSVAYFLLLRWGEKIRNSTPIRLVFSLELTALVAFSASVIYLLGFFGISLVQPKPSPTANRTVDTPVD